MLTTVRLITNGCEPCTEAHGMWCEADFSAAQEQRFSIPKNLAAEVESGD
jgi:hypothetical protein